MKRALPIAGMLMIMVVLLGAAFSRARASMPPVVLVHGCCGGTPSDMADLATRFTAAGYPVYNLQMPSNYDATANGKAIKTFVDGLGVPVHLVAFSMGGLEARYYVKSLGGGPKVLDLTLIDTPNNGDFWGCFVSQSMCQSGSFIKALNAGDDTPGATRYIQLIDTDSGHSNYVLDGGVCLVPVSGEHNSLPHQLDVFSKALAGVQGSCPGTLR